MLLLGSGKLGKEFVLAAQRLGVETVAVDRYEDAPAMQAAHRSHAVDMTDATAVREVVDREEPALIVPEIEAIATDELERLEEAGHDTVPTARATRLTMTASGFASSPPRRSASGPAPRMRRDRPVRDRL